MHPIALIAPQIRSAHNVGSFFRIADSAGLAHVHLCGWTAQPGHKGIAKTALGAEATVPWSHTESVQELIPELQSQGWTVAALERTPAARPVATVDAAAFPLALVLGHEVDGVAPEVLAAADLHLALPQYGQKASLNVSVACGVAAYGLVARYRELQGLATGV